MFNHARSLSNKHIFTPLLPQPTVQCMSASSTECSCCGHSSTTGRCSLRSPRRDATHPAVGQQNTVNTTAHQCTRSTHILTTQIPKTHFHVIYPPFPSLQSNRFIYIYRVSQEEWTKFRESVPYVKLYRYNPKHLYPKLNGYGDNGKRSLKL